MLPMILLDDQRQHTVLLQLMLSQICEQENIDAEIIPGMVDPEEVLSFAKRNHQPALYFLDIELEQAQNGINLCMQIRQLDEHACIIYVSAYQHYAFQCLKTHAFDFLLKPFTKVELRECLLAAVVETGREPIDEPLHIATGSSTIVLDQNELLFFSVDRNRITAHGMKQTYTWRSSFQRLMPALKKGLFVQVHRSYLVNLRQIQEANWADDALVLRSGITLPISRRCKNSLREALASNGKEEYHVDAQASEYIV